jgi:hypothetical protein
MTMTTSTDKSLGVGQRGEPVRGNDHDMQIDKDTGLPVTIVPDGEKENSEGKVPPSERLRIDPESRIPRPVQPDIA